MKSKTNTKKTTKKVVKKPKITELERRYLSCSAYYFLIWHFSRPGNDTRRKIKKSDKHRKQAKINDPRLAHFTQNRHINRKIKFILTGLTILIVVIVAQLLYPDNRTLPFARLQTSGNLGYADNQQILQTFQDFDSRLVTIHTHNQSVTTSYRDLGVRINYDATIDQMIDYKLQDRLIPFSSIFKTFKHYKIIKIIDDSQLSRFATDVIPQVSKKPIDAKVVIGGTKISVNNSEDGYEYQESVLKSEILRSDLSNNSQIVFPPTILKPNISTDIALSKANTMQSRINNPLIINADGKTTTFNSQIIASWVDIIHKPDQKTVDVVLNKDRIMDSLEEFKGRVNVDMVPAVNILLNGNYAGRIEGVTGKSLRIVGLANSIADSVLNSTATIEASVDTIIPKENTDRRYTKDSAGVQNLLDYWTKNNPGRFAVDFRSANERIVANINPNDLMSAIGIHRIFISSLIYNKIASGSINLYDQTISGSVGSCLQAMIIYSDDNCTNALGALVGWSSSDYLLNNQGFKSTTITQGAAFTTAHDTTDWLQRVYSGNIVSFSDKTSILDLMSNQIVRNGIPAGSVGIRVDNKAISYGRYNSDVGIVYNPGGTYFVTILSEGSSMSAIADLTGQLNKIMQQ